MVRHDIARELRDVALLLVAQKDFRNALPAQRIARLLLTGEVGVEAGLKELARYELIARADPNVCTDCGYPLGQHNVDGLHLPCADAWTAEALP